MKNKTLLRTVSIVLALCFLMLCITGCGKEKAKTENEIILDEIGQEEYTQTEYTSIIENTSVRKQETVYVNLSPDGTVSKVNVTDWIHSESPQVRVFDMSNLLSIKNVKTLSSPLVQDEYLVWDMDTTDLYYSGISNQEPPVSFDIKYFLNDVLTPYDQLAGKSGQVKILIKVNNNLKKTVETDGEEITVSCPMIMVGGMILPEEKFSNISVINGTSIGDGTKQIAFFAGVPGMDESLGLSSLNLSLLSPQLLSDTYVISADVKDFTLGNMMFAVLPFSAIGSIGNGELPETVDEVKAVLNDVQALQAALNGLDLEKIVSLLYGDTDKVGNMLEAISDAIQLYNENEKLIKTIDKYMTDENIQKLDKLVTDINNTDINAISSTLSDPAMQNLLRSLPALSSSLQGISVLASDLNDVMPMIQAMDAEMQDPEVKASVERLPQTLQKLKEILAAVEENRELLNALGAFTDGSNDEQLQSILDTAKKYINTDNLTEAQMQTLAGKTKEWLSFGMSYNIFTQKVKGNSSSVIFTYKTEAINKTKK